MTDEYRRRTRDPKPIRLHRYVSMFCATRSSVNKDEIEIHKFNHDTKAFSKAKTLKFEIRNISDSIFAGGKIFAFGKNCLVSDTYDISHI